MTFHARLTELLEKARLEPPYNNKAKDALKEFLVNHAEAIRDLVVAAEDIRKDLEVASNGGGVDFYRSEKYLSGALAKLEES